MNPALVYLLVVLAVALIGWLWWEWRCALDGWRSASEQRDRAVEFSLSLVESLDAETGPLLAAPRGTTVVPLPPRRAHLRSVE